MSTATVEQENCQSACAAESAVATRNTASPGVNIFETKDGYILEAELPGVSKANLDLTVEGTTLTILGRRPASGVDAGLVYRETVDADYRRAFELDPAIDTTRVTANIEQGLLRVQLPKAERVKARKIEVND